MAKQHALQTKAVTFLRATTGQVASQQSRPVETGRRLRPPSGLLSTIFCVGIIAEVYIQIASEYVHITCIQMHGDSTTPAVQ